MVKDIERWLDGWSGQFRPDAEIERGADGMTVSSTHPCPEGDVTYFFAARDGISPPDGTVPVFPSSDTGHMRLRNQVPAPRRVRTVTAWGAVCPLCMDGIDPCSLHVIDLSTVDKK